MHWRFLLVTGAVLLGVVKGRCLLWRTAARSAGRIHQLADRTPFWQLFSRAMYLLMGGMMLLGIACRWIGAHWHVYGVVGVVYVIVGVALFERQPQAVR